MSHFPSNPLLRNQMLPLILYCIPPGGFSMKASPLTKDFYYHPHKRVEAEQKMERAL
jgi:hypothetical protein